MRTGCPPGSKLGFQCGSWQRSQDAQTWWKTVWETCGSWWGLVVFWILPSSLRRRELKQVEVSVNFELLFSMTILVAATALKRQVDWIALKYLQLFLSFPNKYLCRWKSGRESKRCPLVWRTVRILSNPEMTKQSIDPSRSDTTSPYCFARAWKATDTSVYLAMVSKFPRIGMA